MNNNQDVATLFDEMKLNWRLVLVWLLCAAVLLLDGYDLTVIALMAPELVKEFGLAPASLGVVFAAGLTGMALGGPLGGWIGDRYGRKLPAVLSCCLFGCATLGMLTGGGAPQLAAWRFVVGLGLGVVLSSAIAICAEFAPGRMRSRVMMLVGMAVPVGAIIPGVVTATLVPLFGWRLLVLVGGVLPILLAIALVFALPESIKFLALRPARSAQLAALLRWLDPNLRWTPNPAAVPDERLAGAPFLQLFRNGFAAITLSMWLLFFMNAVALSLVSSWLPLTLRDLGLGMGETGRVTALFSVAGMVGCLVVAGFITRAGVLILPALFLLSVVFLLGFAMFNLSYTAVVLCVLVSGFTTGTIQVACTTVVGTLYGTAVRASGIGWAYAMGRVGAIAGPFFGGLVYSLHLPPQRMFTFAAMPMGVGAFAAILLPILCLRRFGRVQVDRGDREVAPVTASRSVDPDDRRFATRSAPLIEGAQATTAASARAPK